MRDNLTDDAGKQYAADGIKGLFRKRATQIMIAGILLTALGAVNIPALAVYELWTEVLVPLFTAFGTTIIAASVVGFILADKDYMKLLKEIVVSVIFNPEEYKTHKHLIEIWRKVSLKLLDKVLPFSNDIAIREIEEQFFSDKKDYHFEDVDCDLSFDVNESEGTVLIKQEISASLVITPNCEHPILKHFISMQDTGVLSPIDLMLNGDSITVGDYLRKDPDNPNKHIFEYPLKDKIENDLGRRTVKYKRVVELKQVLSDDPSFSSNITRFVKGYSIEAKVTKGYKLIFDRFGVNAGDELKPQKLGKGKLRWELAKRGDLLLPGEAYILTVSKGEK